MKNNPHGLTVGQKLWWVSSQRYRGESRYLTITKLGTKWVTLNGGEFDETRIEPDTLIADGGQYSSPGRCWLSREEHEAHLARQRAWDEVRTRIPYHVPSHLSAAGIKIIADLLKIEVDL